MKKQQKTDIEEKINELVSDFHREQLGENASSTRTCVHENVFSVCAVDCLTPAEKILIRNESDWMLFQESKAKQYLSVKGQLKNLLESSFGFEIQNLYSILDKSGIRFELAILSESLERIPGKNKRDI
jgi:uncharacterized protein YbcI